MRTLVDIPDEDLAVIQNVTETLGISRAEFVRRAVTASLVSYREARQREAFGILGREGRRRRRLPAEAAE